MRGPLALVGLIVAVAGCGEAPVERPAPAPQPASPPAALAPPSDDEPSQAERLDPGRAHEYRDGPSYTGKSY